MKNYIKLAVVGFLIISFGACQSAAFGGIKKQTIISDNIKRNYILHVPNIYYKQNKSVPVIFAFHGGGSKASKIAKYSKFNDIADKENFIVVYPNAIDKNWNDGRGVKKFKSHRENIDDAGFVLNIINELANKYKIKRDKVFITGISNGGMFTQRLAVQYPTYFAAAASVVGGMPRHVAWKFRPKQPIPFMLMAGTKDPLMPFEGGGVGFGGFRGKIVSMEKAISKWVKNNHANKTPRVGKLPDLDPKDGVRIKKVTYDAKGKNSAQVIYYEMQEGGHNWPGANKGLPEAIVGKLPKDISATEEIWKFFKKYL